MKVTSLQTWMAYKVVKKKRDEDEWLHCLQTCASEIGKYIQQAKHCFPL